ncbi:hypothetical protein [Frankia sp. QA3]|uniref:hypothetical protein n=1 Tax=Frankia sp. QA3 TaxID=710111 RepID=UPI000269CD01|nr:hypothetical protein [Frankia sp. QA3]EIV95620.1 hypothetical protein FraQA3DRAFT_5459 [Frankia sp. QA3]
MTATDRTPTDGDLAAGIRALRGPLARRGPVEPVAFTADVRARARRHRARVLTGLATALAVLVAAGVTIPLRLLSAEPASTVVPATSLSPPAPGAPYTYGGVTVGWLPTAMTHRGDTAATVQAAPGGHEPNDLLFNVEGLGGDLPWLTQEADLFGPFTYISQFATPGATASATADQPGSTAPAAGLAPPALLWVTATWDPRAPRDLTAISAKLAGKYLTTSLIGRVEATTTTVADQPALLVRTDSNTAKRRPSADHRYRAALMWRAPDGTQLAVEAVGPSPVDPAVLARVAGGLTLVGQPAPPAAPDETTRAAILAAFHDAFAPGVPDDRWAAAVQDGPTLASLRKEVVTRYPWFAATLSVRVDHLLVLAADTVSAGLSYSFTKPAPLPGRPASSSMGGSGEAVRTAAGWQVSRSTYCNVIGLPPGDYDGLPLVAPELRCPF